MFIALTFKIKVLKSKSKSKKKLKFASIWYADVLFDNIFHNVFFTYNGFYSYNQHTAMAQIRNFLENS